MQQRFVALQPSRKAVVNVIPLECVVLTHDLPEHGLRAGDLGAVVETYPPDRVEVEFVTADGHTQALVTLNTSDVRKVGLRDILAVRAVHPAAWSWRARWKCGV